MSVIVTGSIAFDYLMRFPGHFAEHVLLNEVGKISVSFLVEEKEMHRGGIGPNICYSLALLGERPRLMGTAGRDFAEYAAWLEAQGVDTSLVRVYPDEFTATFTVITDLDQNQIAGFHAGAMSRGRGADLPRPGLHGRSIWSSSRPTTRLAMIKLCRGVPGTAHPLHLRPQPAVGPAERRAGAGRMCGAYALTVNDYELEMINHKTGLDEQAILEQVGMLVVTRGADGASLMDRTAVSTFRL